MLFVAIVAIVVPFLITVVGSMNSGMGGLTLQGPQLWLPAALFAVLGFAAYRLYVGDRSTGAAIDPDEDEHLQEHLEEPADTQQEQN